MRCCLILPAILLINAALAVVSPHCEETIIMDIQETRNRLKEHLTMLTRTIGERSVRSSLNLQRTADYIYSYHQNNQIPVSLEPYNYHDMTVNNVVAEVKFSADPSVRYIVGAHYDSVSGTVGADDNASAIAVQLETARLLNSQSACSGSDLAVTFVSFALEEPPAYGTRYMGSRVYAKKARENNMQIDGMICLEMVGYTCRTPGCQSYPFPLNFMGYPKEGNFIGIVGNFGSRRFLKKLAQSCSQNKDLSIISLSIPFNGWILPAVRLSDHASFWDQGFPAVMVTDTAFFRNPNYHLPSDTMETLDDTFMAQLVNSLVGFFHSQCLNHTD